MRDQSGTSIKNSFEAVTRTYRRAITQLGGRLSAFRDVDGRLPCTVGGDEYGDLRRASDALGDEPRVTIAAPGSGMRGLDELHAARNSQDASSHRSELRGMDRRRRGQYQRALRAWACVGVENNEGLKKPALDISVPTGYTDPLRCLLAVPCPSPGACPRLSIDEQTIPTWPYPVRSGTACSLCA